MWTWFSLFSNLALCEIIAAESNANTFVIVDTGQEKCYNDLGGVITCSQSEESFSGQDASYQKNTPTYTNNNDGTITDNNTGLMWQKDPGAKMTYNEAVSGVSSFKLAGYTDWRMPTIKELYSLIQFNGIDPSGMQGNDTSNLVPFIDRDYFDFEYGDTSAGERIIDSQYASSTKYVSTTMYGDETLFGVNFADGRIKGYGLSVHGSEKKFFVMHVRGNSDYGKNKLIDNGNGTITDSATGLMWMQDDSGYLKAGSNADGKMNWKEALEWAEHLEYAGYSDWRLPNAKELQSIVDYSKSPATTNSAAIDPMFKVSLIIDEGGETNYPFYWSSTTHANIMNGANAVYVAFGEALGWMKSAATGTYELLDVHGAGAQRSDPKTGSASSYPYGHGPQGDVIRIDNFVRCVRDVTTEVSNDDDDIIPETDIPTLSENLSIHIPLIIFNGGSYFWIDLAYYGQMPDGFHLWKMIQFGETTNTPANSNSYPSIFQTLAIHIPVMKYNTSEKILNLWAEFEYYGQSSEGFHLWQLSQYGIITQ
ncbi:MAG: DUF1566 domain-containing protein [Desulfobacterales bacterium]|nr:DUF1566 domain-containing protein [Desulfobacterales bacterium]